MVVTDTTAPTNHPAGFITTLQVVVVVLLGFSMEDPKPKAIRTPPAPSVIYTLLQVVVVVMAAASSNHQHAGGGNTPNSQGSAPSGKANGGYFNSAGGAGFQYEGRSYNYDSRNYAGHGGYIPEQGGMGGAHHEGNAGDNVRESL